MKTITVSRPGMTLLEVMIAVAVLSGGILMMVASFVQGGRMNQMFNEQAAAHLAASRKLEEFRLAAARDFYAAERQFNGNIYDDFQRSPWNPSVITGPSVNFNWDFRDPVTKADLSMTPNYFYVPEVDYNETNYGSRPQGEIVIGSKTGTGSAQLWWIAESPNESWYGDLDYDGVPDGIDLNSGNYHADGSPDTDSPFNDAPAYMVDLDMNRNYGDYYFFDTGTGKYYRTTTRVKNLTTMVDDAAVKIYVWPVCIRVRWGRRPGAASSEFADYSEISIRTLVGRP